MSLFVRKSGVIVAMPLEASPEVVQVAFCPDFPLFLADGLMLEDPGARVLTFCRQTFGEDRVLPIGTRAAIYVEDGAPWEARRAAGALALSMVAPDKAIQISEAAAKWSVSPL